MRARARAAMGVVGWDKFLAAGWAPLACWSFRHGVEHEVHSLSQDLLDVCLVVKFLSQLKNELKMLVRESNRGGRRRLLHQFCIHLQVCIVVVVGISIFQLGGISSSTMHSRCHKNDQSVGSERGNFLGES
jgi:hypothetical protein